MFGWYVCFRTKPKQTCTWAICILNLSSFYVYFKFFLDFICLIFGQFEATLHGKVIICLYSLKKIVLDKGQNFILNKISKNINFSERNGYRVMICHLENKNSVFILM